MGHSSQRLKPLGFLPVLFKNIKYLESFETDVYDTITWYFRGPKSLLLEKCPTAVAAVISIETPRRNDRREAAYASVLISPIVKCMDGAESPDFWSDWNIPYEDIEKLMDLIPVDQR